MIVLSQGLLGGQIEISAPTAVATGPSTAQIGITVTGFDLSLPVFGWRNIVTVDNVVAGSAEADHPITNVANPSTYLRWQATSTASQTITITATADAIDYVAIAGHNLGSAGITATLSGLGVSAAPKDDAPLILRFMPQPLGSVALLLSGGAEAARIGVLYVGRLLVMERSFSIDTMHTPFPLRRTARVVDGFSQGGHYLGRIVQNEKRMATVEFDYIARNWYDENFDPFLQKAVERPFFFASNPRDAAHEVGFAWVKMESEGDGPVPEIDPVTGRVSVRLEMTGLV